MLSGKVAWVTGSSKGMGRAIAVGLAGQGCDVIVQYNSSEDDAQEVSQQIEGLGRESLLVGGDVSKAADVKRMAGEIKDRFGRVDVLVNNAGSMVERGTLAGMTEEVWDRVMDVNLKSVYLCSQAVLPMMQAAGRGQDREHYLDLRPQRRQPELPRVLYGQRRRQYHDPRYGEGASLGQHIGQRRRPGTNGHRVSRRVLIAREAGGGREGYTA